MRTESSAVLCLAGLIWVWLTILVNFPTDNKMAARAPGIMSDPDFVYTSGDCSCRFLLRGEETLPRSP